MKFRALAHILNPIFKLLLLVLPLAVNGQNNNSLNNTSLQSQQKIDIARLTDRQADYLRDIYATKVEDPKEFINGKEYEPYYLRSKSKPILFPGKPRSASLITKTRRYDNITLQYDTFADEVIYTDTSQTINFRFPQVALNKEVVEGFNLYFEDDSCIFRNLRHPYCDEKNLEEGLYEVVYEGISSFLIKHESSFYVREGRGNYKYSPKKYISTGGGYFKIKNRKSLLQLTGESSSSVREYLKHSRIRVRKADKFQIQNVLKFYDSLVSSKY